jgi:hypothetical protein
MLAALLLSLCQPGANEVNLDRIQLGMTRQQVADIVRQTPVAKVTDADRFSLSFTMASHHIRQHGNLWRSGSCKLWVVFDEYQRVSGKMLEHDEVDPLAEMLRNAASSKKSRR